MSNGLSAVGTKDERCQACHVVPTVTTHANGVSTPTFSGLATTPAVGTYSATFTAGTSPTCSVYCHNPAGTSGGKMNAANAVTVQPKWNDPTYIDDAGLKSVNNCSRCHKNPWDAGFVATNYSHGTMTIANDCAGCHGHNGDTAGAAGQRHMDGIIYGVSSCKNCHGYPPVANMTNLGVAGNFKDAKLATAGGGGYHTTHLLASVVETDGWTPCLPCHPSTSHNTGGGTVVKANVNVNDAADLTFRFDETRSKRYDTASRTCSNVSCHFQPTAVWY
jgi:hypothetical protein